MKITKLSDIKKVKVEMNGVKDAYKQVPISSEMGTPYFSLRVFTVQPQGHTPYHAHPFEHINYVISGNGVLVDDNGNEKPLSKGDFALVMPNEKHQYKNASANEDFVMICGVPKEYE